jgi:hypothetical protein
MTTARPRFGAGEPRYQFVMNPFPDAACSTCPGCRKRTRQRKLPLLIHVEPHHLTALNYTCRYCPDYDLLIGKQSEIEAHLTRMFKERDTSAIGNEYLVFATVDRQAWRENMENPKPIQEMLASVHDFKGYSDLQQSMGGWYPEGVEPPLRQPPPPKDWVRT